MAKKILITCGTGYVGANLARKLCNGKDRITIFSDRSNHPFLDGQDIIFIQGDIRDAKAVRRAVKGQDEVYHLAATAMNSSERKKDIFDINIGGTENVMHACLREKVKRVVYTSSSAALGFSRKELPLSESCFLDEKDNLYGISKKKGEDVVHAYVEKGLDAV